MPQINHEDLIATQFGSQAKAYYASAVHSQGADLDELEKLVAGHPNARVLDLGCGGGHVGFRVASHVSEVIAYDISSEMLAVVAAAASQKGHSNIQTRQGSVERLPFEDAVFDFVFSRYSAHHWPNLGTALAQARRVLKSSGRAVFIDVVSPGRPILDTHLQAIEVLRDPSHVRDYSQTEWIDALTQAGFIPGPVTLRRLPIDFTSWIERMRTPEVQMYAIRALQTQASQDAITHFDIQPSGSFTMDILSIEAHRSPPRS